MDISSALADPELGFTGFTVLRTHYVQENGDSVPSNETLTASGCIHPGTPETLQLLPEEERHEDYIVVYTSFPLSLWGIFRAGSDPLERGNLEGGEHPGLVRVRVCSGFGRSHA